jgi:hypothetical protein
MQSFLEPFWQGAAQVQDRTWQWFAGLNREEWLVLLAIVCACGFLSLRFGSRRL